MSSRKAFMEKCDECGLEVEGHILGWVHLTQPAVAFCPNCKKKQNVLDRIKMHSPHLSDCPYDADYFLRGIETGKSLYQGYQWLPDLTIPMVVRVIAHCGIKPNHTILDFGCSRGYVVRAFREMGYDAWGVDISEWAVKNCDETVRPFIATHSYVPRCSRTYDWIIAKDVLEHIPMVQETIHDLMRASRIGVFAVVPLSEKDGDPYLFPDYEKDITHIHRLTLASWATMFMKPGWSVEGRFHVEGIKENKVYACYEKGNGFVTARRI